MKSYSYKILIIAGLILYRLVPGVNGQGTGLDGFSLKISPGALTYYGDLSTNNLNVFKRIATGSKFGVGAAIIKQFSPFFGIQAQFITGSLYTTAADNTYFAGALSEFSLTARFDPIKLIRGKSFRLSPYLSVGVGTFGFRSVRREIGTNVVLLPDFGYNNDGVTNARQQTAMSMPMAVGISYKILPFLQIELEHSLRMTNTDLLDCYKGPGTSNDLYSLTSIGLRFSIPSASDNNYSRKENRNKVQPVKTVKPTEVIKTDHPEFKYDAACEFPESIHNGQTLDVRLRFRKGTYTGPVKLIQKFPEDFTPIEDLARIKSTSFSNQNLIINWDKLPSDSVFQYSYRVKVGEKLTGSRTISGRLEYQDGKVTKTIRFNNTVFIEPVEKANQELVKNVEVAKKDENTDKQANPTEVSVKIRTSEPKPGIEFRVQCGAFKENTKAIHQLIAKYKIDETLQEELIDGWYKYTVGSFATYDDAVRYRDGFIERTGILSSFLVAYKDGQRLTNIADALK